MGFRFRKSIKVLPGVRLNVSKTGTSWTIGPRGANLNVGRGKKYVNVGIPGTGLSMREQIDGSEPQSTNETPAVGSVLQLAAYAAAVVFLLWLFA